MLTCLWAGCAPAPVPGGAIELIDDGGVTTRLVAPASRVASLIPATTEWLFALGAGDRLVGRTTWCDYPVEAAAVPSLGNGIGPSLEAILGARPDLVLLYHSPANHDAAARLRALGVPVLQLRTDNLGDLDRLLAVVGRAVGLETVADSLRAAVASQLAAISLPPSPDAPSVFVLAWDQPPMTLGRGSFLSEILERAGGRNLFGDVATSSATISLEAVADRDPDFLLTTSADSLPGVVHRAEWQAVEAVRERRFVRVHGSEFNRPGPRTPAAIATMRRALAAASR